MQKVSEVGAGPFPSINLQAGGDGVMGIGERQAVCLLMGGWSGYRQGPLAPYSSDVNLEGSSGWARGQ